MNYLGMYIDKYLNWNQHIEELSKKLSRTNGILSKLRYNASLDTCIQVYYALFFSRLTYGCNVWGLTSEENINTIERLQKKCTNPQILNSSMKIILLSLVSTPLLMEKNRSNTSALICGTKLLKQVRFKLRLTKIKMST